MISIIIPIYNVESYLEECVQSVIAQTYTEWELILVDDGSTDGSAKIARNWQSRNSRIKYFHKENGGVSSARNYGLDHSQGEYIMFVDSDDICHPQLLEKLIYFVIEGNDIAGCTIAKSEESGVVQNNIKYISENLISLDQIYTCFFNKGILHPPYGKVYRNDIIRKHNIRFVQNLQLGEDVLFNLEYLKHVSHGVFIDNPFYYYRNTPGSLSKKIQKNYTEIQLRIISEKIDFIQTHRLTFDITRYAPGVVRDIVLTILRSKATKVEKQACIELLRDNPIMGYCRRKGKMTDLLLVQIIRRIPSAIIAIL